MRRWSSKWGEDPDGSYILVVDAESEIEKARREGYAEGHRQKMDMNNVARRDAERDRDRLQHIIDCANTPLMADVLRERDEWKAMADKASQAIVEYTGIKEAAEDRADKAEAQLARYREVVDKARGDIYWMLNNQQLLNAHVFDYLDDAALAEGDKT